MERTGRQDAQVRRQMRKTWVELAPEILYELPSRILEIRYQSVTRLLHTERKLYAPRRENRSKKNDSVTSVIERSPSVESVDREPERSDHSSRSAISFIMRKVGA
jgi:hypothetical protein